MNQTDDEAVSISFGHLERERLEFVFPSIRRDSEGWLHPVVRISAGPFFGSANAYCELSDFTRLLPELQSLYDTLRGTATFETIEGQVAFTLTGDGLGHIELRGFLTDSAGGSNRLNFAIAFDQTLLWHSIPEFQDLLDANSK